VAALQEQEHTLVWRQFGTPAQNVAHIPSAGANIIRL
jgi:hypothetical protein